MKDAHEALSVGLVSKVVPQEDHYGGGQRYCGADPLQRTSRRAARRACRLRDRPENGAAHREACAQAVLFTSEDKREGTSTFVEKRKPEFGGREEMTKPNIENVNKILVIGEG